MDIPSYYLEPANYEVDFQDLHYVRNLVFVVEQQIPVDVEFDQFDRQCHHFIARDNQGRAIGTGRLSPDGKIGRMAVLHEWRRQRVGTSLLRTILEKARNLGLKTVTANAQLTALGFYEQFGFTQEGETFIADGIPHQLMRLMLEPLDKPINLSSKLRKPSVQAIRLETLESALDATLQLIRQSSRQICIYSRDLDFAIYGQKQLIEALKQFALNNRNAVIQIIIQEPARLQGQSHPILELAQRLSSYFWIRAPMENDDRQYASAYVISDTEGYLFRQLGTRYEGHWSPNLSARNRQLREEFDGVWQRSRPCTEFRALGL